MRSLARRVSRVTAISMGLLMALVLGPGRADALVDDSVPGISWRPSGGIVYSIVRAGDMLVMGGTFTQMVSSSGITAPRSRLAAISVSSGELLPWAPNPNGDVRALEASPDGQTIYVGGGFTNIGGVARSYVAAVSPSGGFVTAFSPPAPSGMVRRLLLHDGGLFLGGTFTRLGTSPRGGGAELDPQSGALRAWNPSTNWGVYAITPAADGLSMWVGGPFTSVAGSQRSFVAKVDRSSGALQPWTSGSTCQDSTNPCVVYDIATDDSSVFLAMGGPGGRMTVLEAASGVQKWWSGGDGDFQTVVRSGDVLYAGGHFATAVNGVRRAGLVALSRQTGAVLGEVSTQVLGGSGVWDILLDGSTFRFAGQFSSVGGVSVGRYSSFPMLPNPIDASPPAAPGTPQAGAVLSDLVSLLWSASSDNIATVEYRISRNGQEIGRSPVPLFKDGSVAPATTYVYSVTAVDGAGNVSSPSRNLTVTTSPVSGSLLSRGAPWRLFSRGTDPGPTWIQAAYDDSAWAIGGGEFGFGDGDEATYISPLGVVHYFRTAFQVTDPSRVTQASVRMLVDDGAVVYLNGSELSRVNVPTGTITNTTAASSSINGISEMGYRTIDLPLGRLLSGRNQLAVSVHNASLSSSDVSFDLFIPAQVLATPSVPSAPTGLSATATSNSVALTWSPGSSADSFVIRRNGVSVGTSSASSFTDANLSPNTAYTYTVSGVNAVGEGQQTAPLAVTTLPERPKPPANLTVVETTSSSVSLSWEPSSGATSYVVMRNGIDLPATNSTSLTDSALDPSSTYSYTVRAVNLGGSSDASAPVAATTLAGVPGTPKNLAASNVSTTSLTLSWDPVASATGYVVVRDGEESGVQATTSYLSEGLTPGTAYSFSVLAANEQGRGALSPSITVTTLPAPPEPPTGFTVTGATGTSISLSWNPSARAADYVVSRGGVALAAVTGTTLTDSGLQPTTTYTYTVRARNGGGWSEPSGEVTGTTTAAAQVTQYTIRGDAWRMSDSGADLGTAWRASGYDDSSWRSGPTEIGYGDGDEATTLSWGADPTRKPITYYLRREFQAGDSISDVTALSLRALVDDGAIVYLNGQEVWRYNLPTGAVIFTTRASTAVSGAAERQWMTATLPVHALRPGGNTLAVEVHNDAPSSSDISFNLELLPIR